jgi:Protein of unknown function (DUF4019)
MRRATLLALVCTWAFHCSIHAQSLSPEDVAARGVALQWLQLVDSGDYKDAALQTVEQVRVLQNWLNYFAAHRAPLGAVKNRKIVEVKHTRTVRGAAEYSKYDIIRLKTSFERTPAAREEVVLTKMSCCWEVSGYTIFDAGKRKETREHAGEFSD